MPQPSDDEESLFDELLAIESPEQRSAFLDERLAGNPDSRQRMEALLEAYAQSEFLEEPLEAIEDLKDLPTRLRGKRIGPYEVIEGIGSGGMGDVYRACVVTDPLQVVAIKVIKPGTDTLEVIKRFEREREILHSMSHPNIATYVGSGVTDDGAAYFAMEYVPGIPIQEFCDRHRLGIADRISLFHDVCSAVRYAHQKGIIHRDIKPSNVLVCFGEGKPVAKVIDFGIAKELTPGNKAAPQTSTGLHRLGTSQYVSPEQARSSADVDVRSDVYSLGVVLCELLSGLRPTPWELDSNDDSWRSQVLSPDDSSASRRLRAIPTMELQSIAEARGLSGRELIHCLQSGLDWILRKVLSKDRKNRYQSVNDLESDLKAWMERRPIQARTSQVAKVLYGNDLWATSIRWIATLMLLVIGLLLGWAIPRGSRSQIESPNSPMTESMRLEPGTSAAGLQELQTAYASYSQGDHDAARRVLERMDPSVSEREGLGFVANYLRTCVSEEKRIFPGFSDGLLDADLSPDGKWLVIAGKTGELLIWDYHAQAIAQRFRVSQQEICCAKFSPDGHYLAVAGQDKQLHVWRIGDWVKQGSCQTGDFTISAMDWSPDSTRIATGDRNGALCVWNATSLQVDHEVKTGTSKDNAIKSLKWSSNGKWFAAIQQRVGCCVWNPSTWEEVATFPEGQDSLAVNFSFQNRHLFFGGYDKRLWIAKLSSLTIVQHEEMDGQIRNIAVGEDDDVFVGKLQGGIDFFVKRGDLRGKEEVWTWKPVRSRSTWGARVNALVHHSGTQELLIGIDPLGQVLAVPIETLTGISSPKNTQWITLGANGKRNTLVSYDTSLQEVIWSNAITGEVEARVAMPAQRRAFPVYSERAQRWAIPCLETLPDASARSFVALCEPGRWSETEKLDIVDSIRSLSFSEDGQWLAVGCRQGTAGYWNLDDQNFRSLEPLGKRREARVLFSTVDSTLVHYNFGGRILRWYDPTSGTMKGELEFSNAIHACCFSPEGLLLIEQPTTVEVWDLEEKVVRDRWNLIVELEGDVAEQLCFSPDGSTLAISFSQSIQCWNWKSKQMLMAAPINGSWKDWRKSEWENRWIAFANPSTLLRYRINRDSLTVLGERGQFQMPIQSTAIRE